MVLRIWIDRGLVHQNLLSCCIQSLSVIPENEAEIQPFGLRGCHEGARRYDNEYFHEELRRELLEELDVRVSNICCIVPRYRTRPREADSIDKHGNPVHYCFLEYLCDYEIGTLAPGDDLAQAMWVKRDDLAEVSLTPPSQEMYREFGWIQE